MKNTGHWTTIVPSFHRTMQHYKDCIELFNDGPDNPFLVPNKVDEFHLCHDGPSNKILPTSIQKEVEGECEGEEGTPAPAVVTTLTKQRRLCLNVQLNIKPKVRDEFIQLVQS